MQFAEIYELARDFSGYSDATRIDYFDTDARTSTFITKDSLGNYGFGHRSFMEFFVASTVMREIGSGGFRLLQLKELPGEVLYFIEGARIEETGVEYLRKWSRNFKEEILSRNSVRVLLRIGVPLEAAVERRYRVFKSEWDKLRSATGVSDDRGLDLFIRDNYHELRRMVEEETEILGFEDYDVDDGVQEVLIALWSKREKFGPEIMGDVGMYVYLRNVIKSILMDRYRLASRNRPVSLEALEARGAQVRDVTGPTVHAKLSYEELWRLIEDAMDAAGLTERVKRAFTWRFRDDKSIDEIALELGLDRKTVIQLLYRVRRILRGRLLEKEIAPWQG